MRRFGLLALAVTVAATTAVGVLPAHASTPRPDLPCQVVVPQRVVIGQSGASITGTLGDCPALLRSRNWSFEDPKGGYAFSFSYDADALYPSKGMVAKLYSWEEPGTYALTPQQTRTFEDPTVGEYGEYYEVPMTASNSIVAKYAAGLAVSVSHKGKGTARTTTVAVRGTRVAAFSTVGASGQTVTVSRDGKPFRTVRLDLSGRTSWTFKDSSPAHVYGATMPETATTWTAAAKAVRG
jgi:hypothetical protein